MTRTYRSILGRHPTVRAVDELDLTLEAGRIYGLLGPNGAGKSTTIRVILGLNLPDRGVVELFGRPPDDAGRARVGYVPEIRALPEDTRLTETLVFLARMRGLSRSDAEADTRRWLQHFDIADKAGARISSLSNGQQQKAQIIAALLGRPALLVLDEPLTALDPTHQQQALAAFRQHAEQGCTLLVATHRLAEAEGFVEHVLLIDRGRKRLDKPLQDALRDAGSNTWHVRADVTDWVAGPDVRAVTPAGDGVRVQLAPGASIGPLLERAVASGCALRGVSEVLPGLAEVFRQHVGGA